MVEVSLSPVERARKNEQVILHALASTGQNTVALAMGVNESTVSRFKDGGLAQAAALVAHCGLKVVPVGMACYEPGYVEALKTLAEVGIRQHAPKLDWSEAA
jgi:hypothetical protein